MLPQCLGFLQPELDAPAPCKLGRFKGDVSRCHQYVPVIGAFHAFESS